LAVEEVGESERQEEIYRPQVGSEGETIEREELFGKLIRIDLALLNAIEQVCEQVGNKLETCDSIGPNY